MDVYVCMHVYTTAHVHVNVHRPALERQMPVISGRRRKKWSLIPTLWFPKEEKKTFYKYKCEHIQKKSRRY